LKKLWQQIDRLLRSRESFFTPSSLQQIDLNQLVLVCIFLGATYGFFMSWYGISSRPASEWLQISACLWKVPVLFLMTLFICFPSLYVFSTFLGSRLSFLQTLKLLVGIVGITVIVLASFGPIVAFFSLCTTSYPFMKVLNVIFFVIAGLFGITALIRALRSMLESIRDEPSSSPNEPPPSGYPPVLPVRYDDGALSRRVNTVFRIWVVIYALVGAQMGWVLRPFLGHPGSRFSWFRPRQSNFFIDVWDAIQKLF
jgi:hypothetical protein